MESLESGTEKPEKHFVEILSAVCLQAMVGHFMPQHVIDMLERHSKLQAIYGYNIVLQDLHLI